MRLSTAIRHLTKEYEKAVKLEFVVKPLSYALYQTWRWADKNEKRRELNEKH